MPSLRSRFEATARAMKQLHGRVGNDRLLQIYAFYKQATEGDAGSIAPDSVDFVETAKHEAWRKLAGLSAEAAMQAYIELAARSGTTGGAAPRDQD